MTNDPIADMLTRIRNAVARSYKTVSVPNSKMILSLLSVLEKEGFINSYTEVDQDGKKMINVELKYANGSSAITHLERISKSGLRIYKQYKSIPRVKNNLGISLFSTSKGIMTGEQAKQSKVGGEYIANIW